MKKNYIYGVAVLVFTFLVIHTGWSKGNPFIGKWIHKENGKVETYEFFENGKAKVKYTGDFDMEMEVKYDILGKNSIKIDFGTKAVTFKYTVSSKELNLITPEGDNIQYQRLK